ncbi:MAG: cupredoxin domain-containing protein [Nitrososphaerales archaeon]
MSEKEHERFARIASRRSSKKLSTSAITSVQTLSIVLVVLLTIVTFAYITTATVNSNQISNLQAQVNELNSRVGPGQTNITALQGNISALQQKLASLPVMNEKPMVRNIKVQWTNQLNANQDRFFLPSITVNQGDTIDITFISNDTDAHTFTLESPYNFQINATVPGTFDYLTNETMFTTNATNNSPGVNVFGTPGNVTGTGSFVAKFSGIYEYFCIYHVQLGMFGYLIVLPNAGYSNSSTTATATTGTPVSIAQGAASNENTPGFTPATITVVIGVNNTVTWTNNDSAPHTVTADDGSFSSGNMDPGNTFSFTFTTPGTYAYHCSYHPWMKATVIVKSG